MIIQLIGEGELVEDRSNSRVSGKSQTNLHAKRKQFRMQKIRKYLLLLTRTKKEREKERRRKVSLYKLVAKCSQ